MGSIAFISTVLQWLSQILVESLLLNCIIVTGFYQPVCLLDKFIGWLTLLVVSWLITLITLVILIVGWLFVAIIVLHYDLLLNCSDRWVVLLLVLRCLILIIWIRGRWWWLLDMESFHWWLIRLLIVWNLFFSLNFLHFDIFLWQNLIVFFFYWFFLLKIHLLILFAIDLILTISAL